MARRLRAGLVILLGLTGTLFLPPSTANAQQVGHYVEGATGLENGTQPPPGLYVGYLAYLNPVESIKGPNGNTVVKPDITVAAHFMEYAVTTEKKILGANYGLMVLIPAVNQRFTSNLFDTSANAAGLSDMFFSPIVLGWAK